MEFTTSMRPCGKTKNRQRERYVGRCRKQKSGEKKKSNIVNTLNFRYTYISVGLTRVKTTNVDALHRHTLPASDQQFVIDVIVIGIMGNNKL